MLSGLEWTEQTPLFHYILPKRLKNRPDMQFINKTIFNTDCVMVPGKIAMPFELGREDFSCKILAFLL